MKFTLAWLKEYLKTDASVEEICAKLTAIGLEVESCEDLAKSLKYFSVAKIIEARQHPDSNKLKICQVEVAAGQILQIICGAANARSGIKVAYAPIGAVIPVNQMVIKKAKIAGVESNGMLCSSQELGLGEADEGIIEIDDQFVIGTKIIDIYNKSDAIIEINVTPNRGDCLGVYGVARDLAAAGLGELLKPNFKQVVANFSSPINIYNNAHQTCNFAAFRHIKNIKNSQSPKWLKDKLVSIGINSISAVVDITNYVMFCLNRPMHAYDASKIKGKIDIRLAKNGEKFISLKKDEFLLDEKNLIIADDEKILGLAGIIGSSNSSCDNDTTEILLESAYFDPVNISQTGRKLNILSDARYRFERGVDLASCLEGIEMATTLILEICGGQASQIKFVEGAAILNKKIDFDLEEIEKLIGLEVPSDIALRILEKLQFIVERKSENKVLVQIPSHRHDIAISRDLVEEITRIYGYDQIKPQALEIESPDYSTTNVDKVRYLLMSRGMTENINWSFCDHNLVEVFTAINPQLMLVNPISADMDHMRPNLLIGLLKSYQKNYLRGFVNLSFFEIGKVFLAIDEKSQLQMISGLRAGQNKEKNHYNDQRNFDIFDVKKDIFDLLEIFGLKASSLQITNVDAPKYYHPHRSAVLKLGKNIIGYFGEIHPKITKLFDLKVTINAFEVFVDNLPMQNGAKASSKKLYIANDLQQVERDFAFLLDKNQQVGDLIKQIEAADKQLIKQVEIFDIYSGKNIAEEKKSIALRVVIQPLEKTLTSQEIDVISAKIIEAAAKLGAVLR